jgi:septal ring factor EnvC (AmiA/AmiB activator)
MSDEALYTGVDGEHLGVFGNEKRDKQTQQIIDDQKKQIAELTPKLQNIVDMLDSEIKGADSVRGFVNATESSDSNVRAEIQAAARYIAYIEQLKTKFTLVLNETKR